MPNSRPVRGHSFLPCDREFSIIEKKDTIVIATKFETVEVAGDLIKNYKGQFEAQFKASVTKNKEKYKVGAYKRFRFCKWAQTKCACVKKHVWYRGNGISSVDAKKAKLDDLKGLFKYLGQTAIDNINNIPDKLGGGW